MSCDAFFLTCKAEFFLGCCFNADCIKLGFKGARDIEAHLRNIGCKLWRLSENCCIDIADLISLFLNQFVNAGEKFKAISPLILFVGIREVFSYISKGKRTEKGVAYRVQKHVRIRVTKKP